MIVMMANVAQKYGIIGGGGELAGFFYRKGILRSPPGVEMAAMTSAAQARSTPAAVYALGSFVVQAAGVDREALHEKGGAAADRIATVVGQLFQELLMAEEWVRRPRRLEGW